VRAAAFVALVVAAGALFAELGSAGGAGGGRSAAPTYFQQVKPLLDGRCGNCHMAGGIAFGIVAVLVVYRLIARLERDIGQTGRRLPQEAAERT